MTDWLLAVLGNIVSSIIIPMPTSKSTVSMFTIIPVTGVVTYTLQVAS